MILLAASAILIGGFGAPAGATTVTGTIRTADPSAVVNGTIEFTLSQVAQTITSPVIVLGPGVPVSCPVTNSVIGSCTVTGNDALDPAGTFYKIRVLDTNNRVVMTANWEIEGSTIDVATIPIAVTAVVDPPVLVGPTGATGPPGVSCLAFIGTWSSATTYAAGDCVNYSNIVYTSLVGSNLNNIPSSSPTFWFPSGGAPGGASGDVQTNNGAGAFSGGTALSLLARKQRPFFDVIDYGARAIDTGTSYSTTCTTSASSTAVTLAAASIFQNGDGISCFGAGATNAMSTPGAPTVTPSLNAAATGTGRVVNAPSGGATTYDYKIIALKKGGGYTAASAAGTTTTGNAALGAQSVDITSMTRSNNTVTVVTASAHGLATGAIVHIRETSDSTMDGWFRVSGSADNTHFTFNQGTDTRGDPVTLSKNTLTTVATGGTARWFASNHLTWSAVSGAWIYGIYGRTSASYVFLGFSRPTGTMSELYWDDFGSPMMDSPLNQAWIPDTPPATAAHDALTTTVVSGAGTTSIVVADAATNAVTGGYATFDDAPGILAAANAAKAAGGVVLIPPTAKSPATYFVVASYVTLPSATTIRQSGSLYLKNTVQVGASTRWFGDTDNSGNGAASFSRGAFAFIYDAAFPGFYGATANSSTFTGLAFQPTAASTNNALHFLCDACAVSTWERNSFVTGTTSADYMGMSLVLRSPGDSYEILLKSTLFSGGPDGVDNEEKIDTTSTPQLMAKWDGTGNGVGNTNLKDVFFQKRAIFWDMSGFPSYVTSINSHIQGPYTPYFSTTSNNGELEFDNVIIDSTPMALFAALGTSTVFSGYLRINNSFTASSWPSLAGIAGSGYGTTLTGNPVSNVQVVGSGVTHSYVLGQNVNESDCGKQTTTIPIYGDLVTMSCAYRGPVHFPSQHTLFWDLPAPTGVTATVSAGGSVPTGTWYYVIAAKGMDGGYSKASVLSPAAVVTGGNQTVTVGWNAVPGATGYNIYRSNGGGFAWVNGTTLTSLSYVDTLASSYGGAAPQSAGTGLTGIGRDAIHTPTLQLSSPLSGNVSYKASLTAPDLTDDRAWSGPNSSVKFSGTICANVTPVTVNANVTSDQNLQACSLNSNALNLVGRTIRVTSAGVFTTVGSYTGTMSFKVKLCTVSGCGSGTVITLATWTTAAFGTISAVNNRYGTQLLSTTQTAGASSAHEAHGGLTIVVTANPTDATVNLLDQNTATVGTIDSSAALFMQTTVAFSSGSASNAVTARQQLVEIVN